MKINFNFPNFRFTDRDKLNCLPMWDSVDVLVIVVLVIVMSKLIPTKPTLSKCDIIIEWNAFYAWYKQIIYFN